MPNDNANEIGAHDLATSKHISRDTLQLGPRKKLYVSSYNSYYTAFKIHDIKINRHSIDPLVLHGRHFGRSIHAFCNVTTLINNGIGRIASNDPEEDLTAQ